MDQRLLRCFGSLREEAEATQRGAISDIHETINEISLLCEELISDEDVSLALDTVFDPELGVFYVIEKLMLSRERSIQKSRENCLVFVADFIMKARTRAQPYGPLIKDRCISIFQRDESKSVQAASLLPLISMLELVKQDHIDISLNWSTAKVLLKEYPKAKSSGTLRSNILILLGAMVECFSCSFEEESTVTILNLCLDSLDEQLKQKGKDPSFVLVAGAFKCLGGLLTWFDRTIPAGGCVETARKIYSYLEQVLYFREDLKRYEMVKAALRFLSKHACLFKLRLTEDSVLFLRWLEAYCTHVNAQLRDAALPAFDAFVSQVAECLSCGDSRINNAQDIYKKLFAHALSVLDSQNENTQMTSLAVRMIGKLSPVILRFSGEIVLQQTFQRLVAFGSFSQRLNEMQDDSLVFLVALVGAISDMIVNLEDVDNYMVTIVTEAVGKIFYSFPNLFPKQKLPIYVAIQRLFCVLDKKGAIFSVFLNNIAWSSIQRAIEPIKIIQDRSEIELWKSYTGLWSKLMDMGKENVEEKEKQTGEPLGRIDVNEKIFDAIITCVMKELRDLNLKYKVKTSIKTDKENVREGIDETICDLDSDNDPIEPLNDNDMKKFLNLVEFVQDIILSHSTPFYAKWVLPFGKCLVELSSNYPLLSGFYKLLTALIKVADDHGYFVYAKEQTSSTSAIMKTEVGTQQLASLENIKVQVSEAECMICQELFQRYLQEVLIASRRYKLELLVSCLRLCLAAPPTLISLSLLVDPIKVALRIGLRYHPLANVAMDSLERWIIFQKAELDKWLDEIVPFFANYLTITMAASNSDVKTESKSFPQETLGDFTNKNMSRLIVKKEKKEGFQPDALQLTQIRIQRFLGRIGVHAHNLVPDIDLLQVSATGGLAWDTTEQIRFILPFRDDKTDLWLDSLLPRVVELALSASDRGTKVSAAELLHAVCLLMIGNSAKGPHSQNGESVHYEKIYRKVFSAVMRLAADVEQVTRELFRSLLAQMIHWFTSNTQKENPDTMALLDSIFEGLVDFESASLRELSADCFEEFIEWSIRHCPQKADNFVNIPSMLRRLYNRLDHPNPYYRLGASMACRRLYRVMHKHPSIVDNHLLEILFFCIKSLYIAEDDNEQIGTIKQINRALDAFQRLLEQNMPSLVIKREKRVMFSSIDEFLEWLFRQTMKVQEKCRRRCMHIFHSALKVLEVDSPSSWLRTSDKLQMIDDNFLLLNNELCFSTEDGGRVFLERIEQEMMNLCRSLHWYEWILNIGIINFEEIQAKVSNLGISIKAFLNCLLSEDSLQLISWLTPSEFERHESVRCMCIIYLLSFTKVVLYSGFGMKSDDLPSPAKDDTNGVTNICRIVPINDPRFVQLLCLLLLSPKDVGIRHIEFDKINALLMIVTKILKLLMTFSSECRENVFQFLKLLLDRPELDLANLEFSNGNDEYAGSIRLVDIEFLLRGYKHLLHGGLLMPVMGVDRSTALSEKLLMGLSIACKQGTNVIGNFSTDILSLCISLGVKVERMLEVIFDESLIEGSSTARSNAGTMFYVAFRKVIIQYFKFSYREVLPVLLKRSYGNSTAQLVLTALLDDYLHDKREGNFITIQSFIEEFLNHIILLNASTKSDACYNDKLFFLDVLNKLFMLDIDGRIVLSPHRPSFNVIVDSFYSLLCAMSNTRNVESDSSNKSMNLVVQNSALALIPHFINSANTNLFFDRFQNVLTRIVTTFLLVREADLPHGSTHRETYFQTLTVILGAVCSSKNAAMLEVVFPILQNCLTLTKTLIVKAFQQYAGNIEDQRESVCTMCLNTIQDRSKVSALKQAVTEIVLVPILDVAPSDFILNWFVCHIQFFLTAVSQSGHHENSEDEADFLVGKICSYKIVSCLYMRVDGASIRDAITPLVSNQQIMQIATEDSRAKNDPREYAYSENRVLWRELHCQAYNCLAAVVVCTQDQEKIFTILFKDFTGKPLWQQLIDCEKKYASFPVEISQIGSLMDVTRSLRLERKASRTSDGTTFLSSQYVIGATLSQEPSLIHSFVGDAPQELQIFKEKDVPDVNSMVEMEFADDDDFDQHPCLQMVLKVILHLHSKFNGATACKMPDWMKALHLILSSAGTHANICLFIIKVVIKARAIFARFGEQWVQPVLQPFLRNPLNSGGKRFHYMLRDLCITILEWNISTTPDSAFISRLLNYLFEVAPHESNRVLQANLEIIQHLLSKWKDHVTIDMGVVASYLTFGGKNPSTSDKITLMNRTVGLQLLGAMMSVGLQICDDSQFPKTELIKILLSNICLKVKGVYEASAEILGMLFSRDKGLYREQQLQSGLKKLLLGLYKESEMNQYLSIIDKITMHFPTFLEGYSSMIFDLLPRVYGIFRVLSLDILIRCPSALPNLFTTILPFLSKLLVHRDEVAQKKSLQLVAELVKDAETECIKETVFPILQKTFSLHENDECREHYYRILVYLYTQRNMEGYELLTQSLLQGLCDDSALIRESLQNFWHIHLSKHPQRRLLELITRIYDPVIEAHWIHIGSSLLLKLCGESVDFDRPIFSAPLSDCVFKEYTINTTVLGGTLPMTPMFSDTQSSSSQVLTSSDKDDETVHANIMPGMIRATMQHSETLEPDSQSSFVSSSMAEGGSSLFAFSRMRGKGSVELNDQRTSSEDKISRATRRRLIHPSASRSQVLRNVLNKMKRREAHVAQQALERANKVQILRRYRIGDLPDIEIKHSEIIRPLAALAEKDPVFSRLLLLVLCRAIYLLPSGKCFGSIYELKALVSKGIEKMLETTQNNISFICCVLSLGLEDQDSWIRADLIGSVSSKSANFQSGILYLENAILRDNVPWQYGGNVSKRHKGSRGQAVLGVGCLEQAWLELANLYRSLQENDIVLSIYKKHLTKATITHQALEAELSGEPVTALKLYDEAIDKFDEADTAAAAAVAPSVIEQDLWYTRRLHCLARMLNWRAVMDEILFQVDNSVSKLWEPKVQDSYLSLFLKASVKLPTFHANLREFLQPMSEDVNKQIYILNDFSTQVATLAVSNDQFDRARVYIHECYKNFVSRWTEFHPLATSARHFQIAKLQKITELNEFIDHVGSNQFTDWQRLLLEWRQRWPSSVMDDAEAWDDIIQNRLLFFQKFQTAFNKHSNNKGMEYGGFSFTDLLDEERAHVFYNASRGLMKQGSYQAAKSFMNQFVAIKKDNLDFRSYKSIIKLRCFEADHVSIRDQQKSICMLEQVLSYINSTSHKYNQKQWQCGLRLLEGSTHVQLALLQAKAMSQASLAESSVARCVKQLGCGFSAYRSGLTEINGCVESISVRTWAKSALKFAFFCDELLKSATVGRWGPEMQRAIQVGNDVLPDASCYPRLIVKHIMKSLYLDKSVQAHHGIARALILVGQYEEAESEFRSAVKDVDRRLFIPWIPQMLSSLDKDHGKTFVGVLEDIARQHPQAVYFAYNVSKSGLGPEGRRSTVILDAILKVPILESLVRSLEDLTFPEQRLRDGLSWVKYFLQTGDRVKAKEHFCAVFDDCLSVESMTKQGRRSGEYNLKFAREYSNKVVDALGKDGCNLHFMDEKRFTEATSGILKNLQKASNSLKSGRLSLSLFSKWMADFEPPGKNTWSSWSPEATNVVSTIDMFGSYHGFKKRLDDDETSSKVKVVGFDQTLVSLSSKQRPKVLKARGSDDGEYKFVVKGGEDLRLDERIEQIFEVMNGVLNRDTNCSRRRLSVRTYAVIPVSRQCGLLQFVENTRAMDEIIKDGLAMGGEMSSSSGGGVRARFQEWLAKRGGSSQDVVTCYRNMYGSVEFEEMDEKMKGFFWSVPWDALRKGLLKLGTSAESVVALRKQFQQSLAATSICGYVAGVGDRHLSNILVDVRGGSLLPIDFGYSFGTGVIMLPVPELIPFRLTPQLTNVLLPQDAIGLLRTDMIHVMTALRNSKDLITAVMDVFVKEPLLDWKAEAVKANSNRRSWKVADEEEEEEKDKNNNMARSEGGLEERHVALKVEIAHRKLELWNPADVTLSELDSSIHADKPYLSHLHRIVKGDPCRNARARCAGCCCASVQEQIDCLIDQATDTNLLGRVWLGWQPWM